MPVVICPVCSAQLHAADAAIGRPATCPKCKTVILVGTPKAKAEPPLLAAAVTASIPIKQHHYRLLFSAALFVVAIPLLAVGWMVVSQNRAEAEFEAARTYESAGNDVEAITRYVRLGKSSATKSLRIRAWRRAAEIELWRKNDGSYLGFLGNVVDIDPTDARNRLTLGRAWIQTANRTMSDSMAESGADGFRGTAHYDRIYNAAVKNPHLTGWWEKGRRELAHAVELDPALEAEVAQVLKEIPSAR